MARMRSVKPEFWGDQALAENVSRDARLLYIGLWNLADEHARLRGDTRYLKGQLFAYDDDLDANAVGKLLNELVAFGRVESYTVGTETFMYLPKLGAHQRLEPDKVPSRLPPPPDHTDGFTPDPHPDANTSEPRANQPEPDPNTLSLSRQHVAGGMRQAARQRRANPTALDTAATLIVQATAIDHTTAITIAAKIDHERKPHNLAGLIRTIINNGEIHTWLQNQPCTPHHRPNCPTCRSETIARPPPNPL